MSPKLAIIVVAFAIVGAITVTPTAFAQDDESQNASVDVERNNEISQSISQEQEACVNEAEVSVSDDDEVDIAGENEAEVEQSNECDVTQSQTAENNAAIEDNSENNFDIQSIIIRCPPDIAPNCCPAQFENCRGIDDIFPNDPCDIFSSAFIRELCRG